MRPYIYITIAILGVTMLSCSSTKHKNISYLGEEIISTSQAENLEAPTLNIYEPSGDQEKTPVLIYVHGGNWNQGKKEIYWWLGRNFAQKDVLAVLPGYTLSPNATYDDQAAQIAKAIAWTKENAAQYGGDPERIFVTGHSAGGHLVALAVMNPKYNINPDDISGIILNDAAGLDMYHYLSENAPSASDNYNTTWTTNPELWKDASPIYFINDKTPPILSYLGSKTYPSITVANNRFKEELIKFQPDVRRITLDKKHVPMITQYIFGSNNRYDEIIQFMSEQE